MKNRLSIYANSEEIAASLNKTIQKIDEFGETPKLREELLLKYARLKISLNEYEEAKKLLGECNAFTINSNLPENYEIYFWLGIIEEINKHHEKALEIYTIALKKCTNNPELVSRTEIELAISRSKKTIVGKRFTYNSSLGLKKINNN